MTKPFPIRIAFRNVKRSEALETAIRHWVERLAPLGPEIVACDVVIKVLRRGRGRPKLFQVRVELAVPGDDIVAHNAVHDEDMARNPYTAVREAFDAAERQLLDRTGRLRSHPKPDRRSPEHEEPLRVRHAEPTTAD